MSVVIMGWRDVDTDDGGVRGNTDEEALANATFIAHARIMSPAACKCLLQTIEWLEEDCEMNHQHQQIAQNRLEQIRQEWHNLTKQHPTL